MSSFKFQIYFMIVKIVKINSCHVIHPYENLQKLIMILHCKEK